MSNDFSSDTQQQRFSAERNAGGAIGFSIFAAAPRVLHIDGDQDTAMVLSALLVPETQVTHVATLQQAERLLQTEQFALVVMDPDLPDGDGESLLVTMRSAQPGARLLTYSARHPEQRGGFGAFLPKPWTSPLQLWRTVSDLLGLGQMMPAEPQ